MDEKYRDILYLKYINGMNLHEIADILSLPYDTVKSRLKNGREIIRRILRKEFSI